MAITEVAILKLAKPSTRAELQADPLVVEAAKTVSSQPGCLGARWDVAEGDDTQMVWLIEWKALSDHRAFEKSDIYKPFLESLGKVLDKETPFVGIYHFDFSPAPFDRLTTATFPVLHIVIGKWKPGMTPADYTTTFKYIVDQFEKNGQPWRVAASIDEEPELKDAFAVLVAVKSTEEHMKQHEDEAFQDSFKQGSHVITDFIFRAFFKPAP